MEGTLMNALGNQISFFRQNQNMTQEELADRLGITAQAVSKWERGLSLPDATFLQSLCRILHCSADSLLGIQNQETPSPHSQTVNQEVMKQLCVSQEPLSLTFGLDLTQAFLNDTDQNYCTLIDDCRLKLSQTGILMPVVRLRDDCSLSPNEFQVLSYHRVLYSECLEYADERTIPHMMECIYQTVSEHYDVILNHDLVCRITQNLGTEYPALISGIVPEVLSYRLLYQLLKKLWKHESSFHGGCFLYLIPIIELAEEFVTRTPDITIDKLADKILAELSFF